MLIIDPLSSPGHKNFDQLICKSLPENKNVYFVCDRDKSLFSPFGRTITYSSILLKPKNRIVVFLSQLFILLSSFYVSFKVRKKKLLFLSYELPSMVVMSFICNVFKYDLYTFTHNTFQPNVPKKKMLFKLISNSVTHICFAPYIADRIMSYDKKAVDVWLPLNVSIVPDKQIKKTYFMPSSTIPEKTIESIKSSFVRGRTYKLLLKADAAFEDEHVVGKPFFNDYMNLIANSEGIIIPQLFDCRVSGVFFDALVGTSIIYMSECLFSREMKKYFNERIVIVEKWDRFYHYVRPNNIDVSVNNKINPVVWNKSISTRLHQIFS